MYPVCPPDCLSGLGLVYHWQCCGVEVCISLISLLVPFFTFRYGTRKYCCTKSTNPQWTTGHTCHGTGVPAIASIAIADFENMPGGCPHSAVTKDINNPGKLPALRDLALAKREQHCVATTQSVGTK